jgi:hypothetical protein
VFGDCPQNLIQRADPQAFVIRNHDSLMRRLIRLKVHVTANLMNDSVAPLSTERCHQFRTTQITWQLHPGFLLPVV